MSSVNNAIHNKKVVASIIKKNKATLKQRERDQQDFIGEVLKDGLNVLDKSPQVTLGDNQKKLQEVIAYHKR